MKIIKSIILFLLFSLRSTAQIFSIAGIVNDVTTQQPVKDAFVFINKTTVSSITDSTGNFFMNTSTEPYCDVAVAKKGYKTLSFRFDLNKEFNKRFRFELEPSDEDSLYRQSDSIKQENLKLWSQIFLSAYFGYGTDGEQCVLDNPQALRFYFDTANTNLTIHATEPLLVFNEGLGYMVHYFLDEMVILKKGGTTINGYSFYKELSSKNPEVLKKWRQRRTYAYEGSLLHFFRSVYNHVSDAQGFELRKVMKVYEDDPMYMSAVNTKNSIKGMDRRKTADGNWEYKNYVEMLDKNEFSVDTLFYEDTTASCFYFKSNSVVQVKYKNGYEAYEYFQQNNLEWTPQQRPVSFLLIDNKTNQIRIESNGDYYNEWDLIVDGYWRWLKLGSQLPINYLK